MQKLDIMQQYSPKVLFKGWILTHQCVLNQSKNDNLMFTWTPKYLIIDKNEKTIRLYDYEPLISKIDGGSNNEEDTNEDDDTAIGYEDAIVYRVDNFINRETFFNYWKSNCATLINHKILLSRDLSPLNEHNHHLSNKEIENTNYEQEQQQNQQIDEVNTETPSFRFAGLFFKKNSLSATKGSNLKRAKSGIQLERKKLFNNSTMVPPNTSSSYKNSVDITVDTKSSLPAIIRPSRSHESLTITNGNGQNNYNFNNNLRKKSNNDDNSDTNNIKNENYLKLNRNFLINSTHNSILNQENCFEIKYDNENLQQICKYFLCRNTEEKDKWLYIVKHVLNNNYDYERHSDDSLQLCILEAKGNGIQQSNKKKYYCELLINNSVFARTCCKEKKEILFWGENFDFHSIKCEQVRVDLYQETTETKKKKKDTKQPLLIGSVYIPLNTIENTQSTEKWYRLDNSSDLLTISNNTNTLPISSMTNSVTSEYSTSSSSNTTHALNNTKDSISLRIKAKYQHVDILPLNYYDKLTKYFEENYMDILKILEPHLNVRLKDDLSNTLIRVTYKLQIVKKYLCDVIINEIINIEDSSLIFRGNSLATKSIESYMKLIGEKYLKHTLSDVVKSIIETSQDIEIDPSKVINQNNLQSNREELIQILHLVCGRVFNSYNNFPFELKEVFCMLREECLKNGKSDEMCDMLVSASIFLRYICPAILSPNLFNLTQEYPQEKAIRRLTLAAKTLQTIANFSKFGGKEFYMSFDKMNRFVEEHTILMREFLRSISTQPQHIKTNVDECNSRLNSNTRSSPESSIPQTPLSSSRSSLTNINNNLNDDLYHYKKEIPFNSDLIDLGKQMSLLHTILSCIISNLDQENKNKLNKLGEILTEITNFKSASNLARTISISEQSQDKSEVENVFEFDNLYHHAVMFQNQLNDVEPIKTPKRAPPPIPLQNITQNKCLSTTSLSNSQQTTPTKIAAFALDQVQSVTNIVEKTMNGNYNNKYASNNEIAPTTPTSSKFSDIKFDFLNPSLAKMKNKRTESKSDVKNTENELNNILKHLQETEQELKREQKEKHLLELKFKHQQQEHNKQMNNLIDKLIKLEDELRKEKSEMNKLLKAKEDLIDLQKKRIESLTINGSQLKLNNPIHYNYLQQLKQSNPPIHPYLKQKLSTTQNQQQDEMFKIFYQPKTSLITNINSNDCSTSITSINPNPNNTSVHSLNYIRTSEL